MLFRSRAKQVLSEKESEVKVTSSEQKSDSISTSANVSEIINVLKEMDMDSVSPLMAFGTLQNLVDKVKK